MVKTCCICLPLDCGVKTLAVLTIVGTIFAGLVSYFDNEYWNTFWPMIVASGIMSIVWVVALMSPGFRQCAAHSWLIFIVIASMGWYTYTIINGKALDYLCNENNLEQFNDEMADVADETGADLGDQVTEEDCKYGGKTGLIIDNVVGWILNLYFAYVIMKWSKKYGDDYHH